MEHPKAFRKQKLLEILRTVSDKAPFSNHPCKAWSVDQSESFVKHLTINRHWNPSNLSYTSTIEGSVLTDQRFKYISFMKNYLAIHYNLLIFHCWSRFRFLFSIWRNRSQNSAMICPRTISNWVAELEHEIFGLQSNILLNESPQHQTYLFYCSEA